MQNVESAAVNTVIIKLIRFLADSFFMSNKIKKINKEIRRKQSLGSEAGRADVLI